MLLSNGTVTLKAPENLFSHIKITVYLNQNTLGCEIRYHVPIGSFFAFVARPLSIKLKEKPAHTQSKLGKICQCSTLRCNVEDVEAHSQVIIYRRFGLGRLGRPPNTRVLVLFMICIVPPPPSKAIHCVTFRNDPSPPFTRGNRVKMTHVNNPMLPSPLMRNPASPTVAGSN